MNLKTPLTFTFTRKSSPHTAFASLIPKLISEMSMLTIAIVKRLMLRCMATPRALRFDDDDTAIDDVVAICLHLAALQYDLKSKPGTFTGMESFIQVSLIAR
ncbi:hypothetical protein TNCV_4046021 [Trichonephila clavipes]|nr:hypothetical protein TNCV_4046021 [Trichonephila clavipes]